MTRENTATATEPTTTGKAAQSCFSRKIGNTTLTLVAVVYAVALPLRSRPLS